MKYRFLYIKKGRKKVRSNAFDFEAMCLIDDNREKSCGIVKKAYDSLVYMFEGTDITEEDIQKLPAEELTMMCTKLFVQYYNTLIAYSGSGSGGGDKNAMLRSIYSSVFRAWGILPSELARQNPEQLLYVLQNTDNDVTKDIPKNSQIFYGM